MPVPAPYSRSTNGSGLSSSIPGVGDRTRQRRPEDRVRLRRGQEVTVATRTRGLGPVVAAIRVVQRQVHEPGEGDRAVAFDLVADPRHELLVLPDRVEVRHGIAAETRRHVHNGPRAPRFPMTSRIPGPTSVCPPSRIGIERGRR